MDWEGSCREAGEAIPLFDIPVEKERKFFQTANGLTISPESEPD